MQLTKNFSLIELTSSETAARKGLDNTPPHDVIVNLRELCANVLQPLRDQYGKSINITSGYRSPKVNKTIGGSTTSDHCFGNAADFTVDFTDYHKVFSILRTLDFDQLIWEMGTDIAPQWIHVSFRGKGNNRKQVLKAFKNGLGQTKYLPY